MMCTNSHQNDSIAEELPVQKCVQMIVAEGYPNKLCLVWTGYAYLQD